MSLDVNKSARRPSLKLNAATNLAVMGLGIIVMFFLVPVMLGYLGERRYGMWALVSSLVGYFSLLQFGLTSSVFYYVPLFRGKEEPDKVNGVVNSAMSFYLVVGVLVLVLVSVFGAELARFFGGGPELTGLIRVVALAFALGLPGNILNTTVKGYEGFAFVNIITCVTLVLRGGLLLACVWAGLDLVAMGWVLVIVSCASLLGQWIAFRRKCPDVKLSMRYVRWNEFRMLLMFGGVILIASTANALAIESPKQIVGKLVSLKALGIFAVPLMMIGYYRQLVFTVTRVLSPRFSYLCGQGIRAEVATLFLRSSRYVGMIATGIALIFWIAGPSFLLLWTHRPQMQEAVPALLILAVGNGVLLTHRVCSDLLLGLGRQGVLATFEMTEAALIVLLVIVLSKHLGITGAALGMAIPFVIVRGIFQAICICRIVRVRIWDYYRRCAAGPWTFAIGLVFIGRFVGIPGLHQGWISLIVTTSLFLMAYCVLVYVLLLNQPERNSIWEHLRRIVRHTGGMLTHTAGANR